MKLFLHVQRYHPTILKTFLSSSGRIDLIVDYTCSTVFFVPCKTRVGEMMQSDVKEDWQTWNSLPIRSYQYPCLRTNKANTVDWESLRSSCSMFGIGNWCLIVKRLMGRRSTVHRKLLVPGLATSNGLVPMEMEDLHTTYYVSLGQTP